MSNDRELMAEAEERGSRSVTVGGAGKQNWNEQWEGQWEGRE